MDTVFPLAELCNSLVKTRGTAIQIPAVAKVVWYWLCVFYVTPIPAEKRDKKNSVKINIYIVG